MNVIPLFIYLFIPFQSSYRSWLVYIIKLKLISSQVNIDIRSLLCQGFQPDVVCWERGGGGRERKQIEAIREYDLSTSCQVWDPICFYSIRQKAN